MSKKGIEKESLDLMISTIIRILCTTDDYLLINRSTNSKKTDKIPVVIQITNKKVKEILDDLMIESLGGAYPTQKKKKDNKDEQRCVSKGC